MQSLARALLTSPNSAELLMKYFRYSTCLKLSHSPKQGMEDFALTPIRK